MASTKPTLLWCHNDNDSVSNHQPHDCLLNWLFRHRSKKTSKLCITGLCEGNSLVTSEFPTQRASKAENVSIWWHHHEQNTKALDVLYHQIPYVQELIRPNISSWNVPIDVADLSSTKRFYRKLTQNAFDKPYSKVHGANMGPIWGRQDPGGPYVGPMNFAIWVFHWNKQLRSNLM